jgi:AraC-like DNA-binding protein
MMTVAMPAFLSATSSAWAPPDQFDALRATVFAPYGLIRLVKADHRQGRMQWARTLALGAQASFGSLRSDALQAQRPARADPAVDDAVILTWLRSGSIVQEAPCGAQSRVCAGALQVYDAVRPMRFHRSAMHGLNLVLPRHGVLHALQGRAPASGVLQMGSTTLAPFLCAQLGLLERHGGGLPPAPLASALDAAAQLALACLREASGLAPHPQDGAHPHTSLLVAARQYMRQHLHRHDLDAEHIATAVHSSRARLYRAFAAQQSSIAAELRELRLQAAREGLERGAEPIAALAWHCGFAVPATFSRAFRARFGASPQEWRAQHRHP